MPTIPLILIAFLLAVASGFGALLALRSKRRKRPEVLDLTVVSGLFAELAGERLRDLPTTATLEFTDGRTVLAGWEPSAHRGTSVGSDGSSGKRARRDVAVEAASLGSLTAGVGGLQYLDAVLNLDQNVLQALTALSGQQVDGLGGLHKLIDAKAYDLSSIKLRGHIGEQEAFDHLQSAGLDARWPGGRNGPYGNPNTPGYDLIVGDHEVNVKVVGSATTTLTEHFAKYPDTPVIINGDASRLPADAIHFDSSTGFDPSDLVGTHVVLVDDALSLTGIEAMQGHAIDAANFDGSEVAETVPGLGVLVRVVRVGYREGKLLQAGKTDARRARRNAAIDVAAGGGGALAGAKAGAMGGGAIDLALGGASMGAFAATGALFGAISGAFAGNKIGNDIKALPLRDAHGRLERELKEFNRLVEGESARAESEMSASTTTRQEKLQVDLASALSAHLQRMELLAAESALLVRGSGAQRVGWLDQIHAELRDVLAAQRVRVESLSRRRQRAWIPLVQANEDALARWADVVGTTVEHGGDDFLDAIAAAETGRTIIEDWLDGVRASSVRIIEQASAAQVEFSRTVVGLRVEAVADLNDLRSNKLSKAQERIDDAAPAVEAATIKVQMERAALGLD